MDVARRRCSLGVSLLVWSLVVGVWALDQAAPLHAPPHDAAFLGFLIAVGQAVWNLFQAASHITLAVLHTMFLLFRSSMIFIARALRSTLWALAQGTGKFLSAVKNLYTRVLRPALSWSFRKLQALERYLKVSFEPLLRKIQWLKDHINLVYRRFVEPLLDVFDLVRQANRVLRFFHIDVLASLDRVLAQIEQRMEEPFRWIYRRLTDVESWINRIVTLDGLFQRLTLLRSLARDIRLTSNLWWNEMHRPLSAYERARYLTPIPRVGTDDVLPPMRAYLLDGSGPDRARIDEAAADLELRVRHVRLLTP